MTNATKRAGAGGARRKLALYGVAVATVFAGSFAVGRAVDPVGLSNAALVEHNSDVETGDGLPGLATATEELTLTSTVDTASAGTPFTYSFRITAEDGSVTDFELEQTKRMHLIVVRRDFTNFTHEHPTMAAGGTWSSTLTLADPGVYRVFADFIVEGEKRTLGTDLFVAGDFQPVPTPAPSKIADAGEGYQVELDGELVAGEESILMFSISLDGKVVTRIPDYLGAKGHLVALRDGDLAYLHVHPEEDRLTFDAEFPTAGTYRLFLQFDHGGEVRTASFTVTAEEATR